MLAERPPSRGSSAIFAANLLLLCCALLLDAVVGYPDALFRAFADQRREITADDIAGAARTVTPLSRTAAEKIQALRDWAKGRARFANAPDAAGGVSLARDLDI